MLVVVWTASAGRHHKWPWPLTQAHTYLERHCCSLHELTHGDLQDKQGPTYL